MIPSQKIRVNAFLEPEFAVRLDRIAKRYNLRRPDAVIALLRLAVSELEKRVREADAQKAGGTDLPPQL